MKSLKVTEVVHKELKVFVAQSDENMIDFVGLAIMKELKERGHKFVAKPSKSKK
jgi:hypothetical protein